MSFTNGNNAGMGAYGAYQNGGNYVSYGTNQGYANYGAYGTNQGYANYGAYGANQNYADYGYYNALSGDDKTKPSKTGKKFSAKVKGFFSSVTRKIIDNSHFLAPTFAAIYAATGIYMLVDGGADTVITILNLLILLAFAFSGGYFYKKIYKNTGTVYNFKHMMLFLGGYTIVYAMSGVAAIIAPIAYAALMFLMYKKNYPGYTNQQLLSYALCDVAVAIAFSIPVLYAVAGAIFAVTVVSAAIFAIIGLLLAVYVAISILPYLLADLLFFRP